MTLYWILSDLTDKNQQVKLKDSHSLNICLRFEVCEGLVLGLLLLPVYTTP